MFKMCAVHPTSQVSWKVQPNTSEGHQAEEGGFILARLPLPVPAFKSLQFLQLARRTVAQKCSPGEGREESFPAIQSLGEESWSI